MSDYSGSDVNVRDQDGQIHTAEENNASETTEVLIQSADVTPDCSCKSL